MIWNRLNFLIIQELKDDIFRHFNILEIQWRLNVIENIEWKRVAEILPAGYLADILFHK